MICTTPEQATPNRWYRVKLAIAVDGTVSTTDLELPENVEIIACDASVFAANNNTEIMQPLDRVSVKLEIVGKVSPTNAAYVPVKGITGAPGLPAHMSIPLEKRDKLTVSAMHEGTAGTAMTMILTFKARTTR